MLRAKLVAPFVALGLLGAADLAKAAPFDNLQIGDIVMVTILNDPKAYRVTEQAGAPSPADPIDDFISYCIDSSAPIGSGLLFTVVGFGTDITPQTAYLYAQYRDGNIAPGYFVPEPRPDGLQEAIYCTEGDPACTAAGFPLQAQANCAVLGGPGCPPGTPNWVGIENVRSLKIAFLDNSRPAQDLLTRLQSDHPCITNPTLPGCGGGEIPVPEPGSMVLLGSGLVGLAAAIRRRRSQRK
jgi:hypothetical protein